MNIFRDGLNSVTVEDQHWDEALDITQDDTATISSAGDSSPRRDSQNIEDLIEEITINEGVDKNDSIESKEDEERHFVEQARKSSKMAVTADKAHNGPGQQNVHASMETKSQDFPSNLSPDIRSLFESIGDYKPHKYDIKTELKCFIPDYIPAIGDPDPFIKIPRPDGESNGLGLLVIDEPGLNQSDIPVLDLQLRAMMKKKRAISGANATVLSIEHASKNPQEVDKWITSVEKLHRSKPAQELLYTSEMVNVNDVMKPLPRELIEALDSELEGALDPDLDLTLGQYAALLCNILDVPLKKDEGKTTLVYGIHILFSQYLEHNGRLDSDTISAL